MLPLTPLRVRYPNGKDQQFYHKVERYRQGVVFEFVTVGLVARFDIAQFVLRLAVALSLLAMAQTITEVVGYRLVSAATRKVRRVPRVSAPRTSCAHTCLPPPTPLILQMLKNKAYEKVTEVTSSQCNSTASVSS